MTTWPVHVIFKSGMQLSYSHSTFEEAKATVQKFYDAPGPLRIVCSGVFHQDSIAAVYCGVAVTTPDPPAEEMPGTVEKFISKFFK